jgi:hypothetical protein
MQTKHTEAKQSSRTKWTAMLVLSTLTLILVSTSCEENPSAVSLASGKSTQKDGVMTVMRVQHPQSPKFALNNAEPGQSVILSDGVTDDSTSFVFYVTKDGPQKLSYLADENIKAGDEVSLVFYHWSRIQMTTFGSEPVPGELFQIGVVKENPHIKETLSKTSTHEPVFKVGSIFE